ncbi:MAG: nicotinamide riboside transporter PnuC [Bifidobacteriaceae bacterium]|jgi:nicotinamide mononucleotide transporter|nr:nicotinamide riboside transporter PnuC [Bifidobacteriaceae bacterium]
MLEITAFCFTSIYIVLELFQKKFMWIIGIFSALFYILTFYYSKIYADMGFNIYYLIMSFYGLILWMNESKNFKQKSKIIYYRTLNKLTILYLLLAEIIIFLSLWLILSHLTDSPIPAADALLTSLNIIGTFMLTKRYLFQWHIWIIVNILSIFIFFNRALFLTSVLYAIYTITAFIGFLKWKNHGQKIS